MNWLLPAVLLFLFVAAWDGHRKGFVRKSVGIVNLILTLFITSVGTPYITTFLRERTALRSVLQKAIASSDIDVIQTMDLIGLGEKVSGYVAELILKGVAFLIVFILVGILVQGVACSLGIAAKLPILHGLNKKAGLLFGLAEGVVAVWIFFVIVTACMTTSIGGKLLLMIADSEILSWIYRKNLLLLLLKI
jgi:hypothetical protein